MLISYRLCSAMKKNHIGDNLNLILLGVVKDEINIYNETLGN